MMGRVMLVCELVQFIAAKGLPAPDSGVASGTFLALAQCGFVCWRHPRANRYNPRKKETAMSRHFSRTVGILVAGLICSTVAPSVSGADFNAIAIGQALSDGVLDVGQFSIRLPQGEWTVVAKQQVSGSQAGGPLAPLQQQTVAVVRTTAGALEALIVIRTPAATFQVTKWNNDPCAAITDALVKDTLKGRMFMPECFAIAPYSSNGITSATAGPLKEATTWLVVNKIPIPEWLFRVYNTKYSGGDFLHMNSYFPASATQGQRPNAVPADLEKWGREVALAIQELVSREKAVANLPPLPQIPAPK